MSEKKLRNVLVYSSNNSGGGWWLGDDDWVALEEAGWIVHWVHERTLAHDGVEHPESEYSGFEHTHAYDNQMTPAPRPALDGPRYMGALAKSAAKSTLDPTSAVEEWERLTGEDASDQGCNCCGEPHNFTYYDSGGKSQYSSAVVVETALEWS